jgi:hypothetical protein
MVQERLKQRVLRITRLDEDLCGGGVGALRMAMAACPACDLHKNGQKPLRRTEIGMDKLGVGIGDDDEIEAWQVVSLGHHLCAHKNPGWPLVDR